MKNKLTEVALLFFKLGCLSFGGPAAHISMMEEEVVEKRKWMDRQHFLDLIGATNLIPGPNSTEMTMHCGHERAGALGMIVAGVCFIVPAVLITGIFAWFYTTYGTLPQVEVWLIGIKPAVLAIIASAIYKLGLKALKNWELGILGALVLALGLMGVNEIVALLSAGIFGALYFSLKGRLQQKQLSIIPFLLFPISNIITVQITTAQIFWIFLKVGAVLYGSGYVLFAYLDAELVVNGWLTRQQLIDAIAVGQFTPGPVLSTATFIGYQMNGIYGAMAATLGIFAPSFMFVLLLNPFVPRMRKSKILGHFLNSVNIAAVAVMVSVLIKMSAETLLDWRNIVITLLALVLVFGFKKVSSLWLVLGGSFLGFVFSFI